MSRIAKMPIDIPAEVEVSVGKGRVSVNGPNGTLEMPIHPSVDVRCAADSIECSPKDGMGNAVAQAGTARSLIANMVTGVKQGFEKELQLSGIGYRAQMQGDVLHLSLGFSHPIEFKCPADVRIETPSQTRIVIRGMDKQRVGQTASDIRAYRPPEPYKGKGVRYAGEVVARKEAKKKQ